MASFDVFEAMSRRIEWLSQRQTVLANNVANANTPGYVPHDLEAPGFESVLKRALAPLPQRVTDEGHIDASVPARQDPRSDEADETYETLPSGNAVVLEEQMVKVADTQTFHQEMTALYRKNGNLVKIALGKNPR
jgi:flagellar basal-body rod protein FlgB